VPPGLAAGALDVGAAWRDGFSTAHATNSKAVVSELTTATAAVLKNVGTGLL
jgi:hypothetical protein